MQDVWNDTYQGALTDGSPWVTGEVQGWGVLRGGGWGGFPADMRSAIRSRASLGFSPLILGCDYPFKQSREFAIER